MDYDAFNRHVRVSRETFERLETYVAHLLKWQQRINLISPATIDDIWHRHVLDAAQLSLHIEDKTAAIADLGSGAGLPGMVLAILGYENIHLIESDQRKAIFLAEASRLTACKTSVYNTRIESVVLPKTDFITARACAPLRQLCAWSHNLMTDRTICLFAKGKNYAMEIDDARVAWAFDLTLHTSITDSASVILQLQQLTPRPS